MKTINITDKKNLENTSGHEAVELSLASSGLTHLMSVLTNLYSDPRTAVLREYVSNAVDSHKKSGQTEPIDITLPHYSNGRKLIVRDYGVGMSKEELKTIYSSYGASTKRDSNDEIGGFGLGAKSALAIADRFDGVSIKDGVRTEFYIEKNIQGAGRLYFVSSEPSDEASGLEVSVPYDGHYLEPNETNEFFVGFPSGSLRINGKLLTATVDNPEKYHTLMDTTNESAAGWMTTGLASTSYMGYDIHAVIGGVLYTIQSNWIENAGQNNKDIAKFRSFRGGVILNIPIGSVDLTPSREELIYSERTSAVLTTTLVNLADAIEKFFQVDMNRAKSHKEAMLKSIAASNKIFWGSSDLKWRGNKVPTSLETKDRSFTITPGTAYGYGASGGNKADNNKPYSHFSYSSYFDSENKTANTLLLSVDADSSLDKDAATVRRLSKSLREMDGYNRILLLSAEDYDNEWFDMAKNSRYATVSEMGEKVREFMRAKRKTAREENPRPKVKKSVGFVLNLGKERTVERIFADDARVVNAANGGKVYYIKQDEARSVYPYFDFNNAIEGEDFYELPARDQTGFFLLAGKALPKNATVFLLSSRNTLEVFTGKYANAENLFPLVKAYAKKNFKPVVQVTLSKIRVEVDYTSRDRMDRALRLHAAFAKSGDLAKITNPHFLSLARWNEYDLASEQLFQKDEAYLALEKWSGYTEDRGESFRELVREYASNAQNYVDRFFLIATSFILNEDTPERKIEQVITYINNADY